MHRASQQRVVLALRRRTAGIDVRVKIESCGKVFKHVYFFPCGQRRHRKSYSKPSRLHLLLITLIVLFMSRAVSGRCQTVTATCALFGGEVLLSKGN